MFSFGKMSNFTYNMPAVFFSCM